jgi:probable phosphoglycerate mutase
MTRILLVHHGQTEWNRVTRYRGRIDVPLNALGRQAGRTSGWLDRLPVEGVGGLREPVIPGLPNG